MKRALDRIQIVITDSSVSPGNEQQQQQHSPAALSVNAADSGISLSQLQTTAFKAIKDFEVSPCIVRLCLGIDVTSCPLFSCTVNCQSATIT